MLDQRNIHWLKSHWANSGSQQMRYISSETVQRSGYFQSSVSYIKLQTMAVALIYSISIRINTQNETHPPQEKNKLKQLKVVIFVICLIYYNMDLLILHI